jgi:hypothetical protein
MKVLAKRAAQVIRDSYTRRCDGANELAIRFEAHCANNTSTYRATLRATRRERVWADHSNPFLTSIWPLMLGRNSPDSFGSQTQQRERDTRCHREIRRQCPARPTPRAVPARRSERLQPAVQQRTQRSGSGYRTPALRREAHSVRGLIPATGSYSLCGVRALESSPQVSSRVPMKRGVRFAAATTTPMRRSIVARADRSDRRRSQAQRLLRRTTRGTMRPHWRSLMMVFVLAAKTVYVEGRISGNRSASVRNRGDSRH